MRRRRRDAKMQNRKRTLAILLFFAALCLGGRPCFGTTVTGTLKKADGTVIPEGLIILRLSQAGTYGGELITPTPPVNCKIAAGVIAAKCVVVGNDVLSPAGTFYWVDVVSGGGLQYKPRERYTIDGDTWDIGTHTPLASSTIGAAAYQVLQDEGTALIQQRTLNLIGTPVTCVNDAAGKRTNCTFTGTTLNFANEEGPAGQINGVNVTFTLERAPSPAKSLKLVLDGLLLHSGADCDFILAGNTITFNYPPAEGSVLVCWYEY